MSLRVSLGLSITALNRALVSEPVPEPVFLWNLITQDRHAILTQDSRYIQVRREELELLTQSGEVVKTQDNRNIII